MMQAAHWQLLAELADGTSHHVTELSKRLGVKPPQLNGFWQQMPPHIRGLLRQQDGRWRLVRSLAIWDAKRLQQQALQHGWQAELLHEHPSSNTYLMEQAKGYLKASTAKRCSSTAKPTVAGDRAKAGKAAWANASPSASAGISTARKPLWAGWRW